jgi:LmbE family N-acetylglucosaminyl deacetylase
LRLYEKKPQSHVTGTKMESAIVARESQQAQPQAQVKRLTPENWETPKNILVILAHPDDPEFFCGATLARWTAAGHSVSYCLITCGDKGTKDRSLRGDELCGIRQCEQQAAAEVLGVRRVRFLGHADGYLVPDINLRREITRVIRQERPDVVVACDPLNLYGRGSNLNHPDHRAAGQVVLDAIFPAARDHLYFPELLEQEGLEPHIVGEVWVSIASDPDITLDVTDFWEQKIRALQEHRSQIGDPENLAHRMRERRAEGSSEAEPRYEEKFKRLIMA